MIFIFFLFIVLSYQLIIPYNQIIINAIIFSFIPSLLPCLIITNFIIETDTLTYLYNKLINIKLGKLLYIILLIIISSTLGMPSLQILLKDQYNKKIIDKNSFKNFIYSFGTVSFPFLYGVCFYNIENKYIAILILIIHYFVNIITFLFMGFKVNKKQIKVSDNSFFKSLNQSFLKSIKTISIITCSVILFSLFLFQFEKIPSPWKWLVEGLIEFSYPSLMAAKDKSLLSYGIVLFISLFPSLSMIVQGKIINNDLNLFKYIFIRLIDVCIGISIFTICLSFY